MPVEEPITITLPPEMSRRIRAKIAESGYKDTLDVLQDGLDALEPFDDELHHWLTTEVVAASKEYDADPTNVRSMEQVGEALKTEFVRLSQAR